MAATFPGGVKVFTTKAASDQIASAHINDLQAEVVAVETELRKTTGSVVDHGGLAGLADNDHPQYLLTPTISNTTPTPTASSGKFTTASAACKTTTFGKIRVYSGLVYIEDKGNATGTLRVPIPSGTPQSLSGGKWAGFGHNHDPNKACDVSLNPSNSYLEILLYDGTTAIASGAAISFTIVYEIQ